MNIASRNILVCLTISLLCGLLPLRGQTTRLRGYSVKDGLSNNTVKAICQDHNGYIWIGTKNGLNRLDGYGIETHYHTPDHDTRQPNDIVSIDLLSDGLFWIGTFSGVVLFDPQKEEYLDLRKRYEGKAYPSSVVTGVHEATDGSIYVATKQGLFRFSKDGHCSVVDGFKESNIQAMVSVAPGKALIDICQDALKVMDFATGKTKTLRKNKEDFSIMTGIGDRYGRIWCGRDLKDIYCFDPQTDLFSAKDVSADPGIKLHDNFIHGMLDFNDSTLLLAADQGAFLFDKKRSHLRRMTALDGLSRLMTVYADSHGNLWTGTFRQGAWLNISGNRPFRHYPLSIGSEEGLHVVGRPLEYGGRLWIGHDKGLISVDPDSYELPSMVSPSAFAGLSDSELCYADAASEGRMLLGFLNKGLYEYDVRSGLLSSVLPASSAEEQIRSTASDARGQLWVAANDLGFIDGHNGEFDRNLSTNFSGITRHMLTQDVLRRGEDMLVGARTSGLWIFRPDANAAGGYFKGVQPDSRELTDINVSVIHEDSKNCLWIGTYDNGLLRWNPATDDIVRFDTDNGLLHNSVCDIVEDPKTGDIYVSTVNGLSRISDGKITAGFNRDNGFPLDEVSPKSMSFASNGRLYIGGSNGLAEYDPSEGAIRHDSVPAVRISRFETLDAEDSGHHVSVAHPTENSGISLPHDGSSVRISFSVLDFVAPGSYRYAYRLKGLDDDWHEMEHNEVVYSNLPAGSYEFEVKARDNAGHWSQATASLPFKVRPALWATWWARLLYAAFVIAFIYVLFRYYRNKKESAHREEIERIEKENIRKDYNSRLQLFTNFSHELRTPLTLISGPVEDLMEDDRLPEPLRKSVGLIQKNSHRLTLLVNQLLDFRKLEHGTVQLRLSRMQLPDFVQEIIDGFSELLQRNGLTIDYRNTYQGEDVWVDANLMGMVMLNLLSNAVKHSKEGERIEVATYPSGDGGGLCISVKDHGEGISRENLKHVFDPFFQIGSSNRKRMFGSGIGLSMVRYIVGLHKGEIEVESDEGEGATFMVELPSGCGHFKDMDVVYTDDSGHSDMAIDATVLASADVGTEADRHVDSRPTVLLVEDDPDMRAYVASKLSAHFNVIRAKDGREGLDLTKSEIPDLILSDIVMPDMDGLELCRAVKSDRLTAHIPVVLLTARNLDSQIEEGYEALADDYVLKPFKFNILKAKIDSILANRTILRGRMNQQLESATATVEEVKEEVPKEDPFMVDLIQLITELAHEPGLCAEVLYTELKMSRTQFFRKIKALSDVSPNKLILNIRMKMAVERFKAGGQTISEVAYEVGFSDPAYFTKVFKSVFSQTPTEFIASIKDR